MARQALITQEALDQEIEWRKCQNDVVYFLQNYWYISVPGGSPKLSLRPPQLEAIKAWESGENTLSLKARQIGWSTIAAAYAFWRIFFRDNEHVVMLSRTEKKAKDLLGMLKYGFNRLPDWMLERGPGVEQNIQLALVFNNGSLVESMPSRENAARGTTASLIIVDEWAFFIDPANAWASIEPATDIGGQIIGISTANGLGNWFHRFWQAAERGQNNFKPMFFPWDSIPERDADWYAEKVRNLEPWQLRQEYPTTAEEAFISSGNPVFDADMLRERIEILDPIFFGRLGKDEHGRITFIQDEHEGNLSIWDMPRPTVRYGIGADIASGGQQAQDWSTAHVIDARTSRVVAVFRAQMAPEDFAEFLDMLGRWYNDALLGPEKNTHGLTVIRLLAFTLNYPNLYFHTRDNIHQTVTRNPGWLTTNASKATMINDLAAAMRRGKLVLHCADTFTELLGYNRRINHASGVERFEGKPHDDLVISLAIANQMLLFINPGEEWQPQSIDAGPLTFNFALSLIQSAPKARGQNTIGYVPKPGSPVVYV